MPDEPFLPASEKYPAINRKAKEIAEETIRSIHWFRTSPIKEQHPYGEQLLLELVIQHLQECV